MDILEIKDEQGKIYQFEKPEHNIALSFVNHDKFIYGFIKFNTGNHIRMWNKEGQCYTSDYMSDEKYNLIPIKPKWYEDKSQYRELTDEEKEHQKVRNNYE